MKKVLKIIGIIILVFILILLIHTIRNYIIVSKLTDKISVYKDIKNYNAKFVNTDKSGTITVMDYYKKDNKQVNFLERNYNGSITKLSFYNNGETVNLYAEDAEHKTVEKNSEGFMAIMIFNEIEFDKESNFFTNFLITSTAIITSEKCEGQDCYKFRNIFNLYNGDTYYINKNSGLTVKSINNDFTVVKEYKFDCVEDSIFTEPDINEYELIGNNK